MHSVATERRVCGVTTMGAGSISSLLSRHFYLVTSILSPRFYLVTTTRGLYPMPGLYIVTARRRILSCARILHDYHDARIQYYHPRVRILIVRGGRRTLTTKRAGARGGEDPRARPSLCDSHGREASIYHRPRVRTLIVRGGRCVLTAKRAGLSARILHCHPHVRILIVPGLILYDHPKVRLLIVRGGRCAL